MSEIAAHGLAIDVPSQWEGRIFRRVQAGEVRAAEVPGEVAPEGEETFPVVHVATIPLPLDMADYGSDVVEELGPDDALIVIKEFNPADAGQPLFEQVGLPREVRAEDLDPRVLQRRLEGQAGSQTFFNDNGRAFCLYVVVGSYERRVTTAPRIGAVLETIRIDPLPA
jgi:hypothetical protein